MFFYLLIPVVLTAACGFLLTHKLGTAPAFGPFLSICTTVLFLMLAGICNLLFAGTIVWYAACAAALAVYFAKERLAGAKRFARYLLSPGVLGFLVWGLALCAIYIWNGSFYSQWDEYGFWGPYYKNIFESDSLLQFTPYHFVHPTYPQAFALFYYFLSFFAPAFSEAHTFCAVGLIFTACAACLLGTTTWRHRPVASAFGFLMVPLFFALFPYADPYISVYTDVLCGAVFGACLILCASIQTGVRSAAAAALGLACLVQMKEICILLALVCIAAHWACVWGQRQGLQKRWLLCALSAVGGLGSFAVWRIFLLLTHTASDQFSFTSGFGLFFQKISGALNGTDRVTASVLEMFKINFFYKPVFYNGYGTPFVTCVLLAAFALIFGVWMWRAHGMRGQAVTFWAMPFFFGCYLASILYTYLCFVSEAEALRNASYERYISTFLIGWVMAAIFFCIEYGGTFFPFRRKGWLPAAVCIAVTALIVNTAAQRNVLNIGTQREKAGRANFDAVCAQMRAETQPGDDIWLVAQHADGMYWYMFHYTMYPARVKEGLPYTIEGLTPEEFLQMAHDNSIEYLLAYVVDDAFCQTYSSLFDGGVAQVMRSGLPSLYRVTQTGFSLCVDTKLPSA